MPCLFDALILRISTSLKSKYFSLARVKNIWFNGSTLPFLSPIVHGGYEVALKHGGRGVNLLPLSKIQTTKAVDLKLGTLIK